jgi:hypothetical protein
VNQRDPYRFVERPLKRSTVPQSTRTIVETDAFAPPARSDSEMP